MSRYLKLTAITTQIALLAALTLAGAETKANGGRGSIKTEEMREWLTYLSSDDLEGRDTFSEGLGLAAGYIAAALKSWGVRPGNNGSYFQRVAVQGVKATNNSTITVEVNGQSRTFKNGEGVGFSQNVGARRTFTSGEIEFMGYGLSAPDAGHDDYAGKNVKGKVVIWMGSSGPKNLDPKYRRLLARRSGFATEQPGAVASIGPAPASVRLQAAAASQAGQAERPDFTTILRLDKPLPPSVSAQDEFFEFLFSGSDVKYAELKEKADKGEPLPPFTLKNARVQVNLDADYRVVNTRYTRNVIGMVEGSDPRLKNTYVAYGAHYDHVGYAEGDIAQVGEVKRRVGARGRVTEGAIEDRIWNGADDDGSGTVGLMALAKAFANGQRPRRSVIFVWHTGEERGLWGSRYFADNPTVPIESIVAQVNMDMIGRDFNNRPEESNSVFVVGSDRISTELHNITIDANAALAKPLALNFAMNEPTDPEQIYYRSDHYSYAAKGIPIVFLFTGIHPDYHANTDSVEKINFEKMTRVVQFAYEIGSRVANLDHAPARDNRGPRAGRENPGKLKL